MLVNHVHLKIQSGDGGHGCESFMRRNDRKIVPNGGDGAGGGRVIFLSDANVSSLGAFRFRQHILAETGGHGGSNRKRGKVGKDTIIRVPVGTQIYDLQRNLLIRDLVNHGDEVVALEGGKGGSGNFGGKKATFGEKGKVLEVELRHRIDAEVCFVGLPNSGKSTLLNLLTRTHVKTENYPFSTRGPEIGIFKISDFEQLTLCELPSIYDHSHEGRGLGAEALCQLDRARFIFYVLDPVSRFTGSVMEGFEVLREQVKRASAEYAKIPYGVILNKIDLEEAREQIHAQQPVWDCPVFEISSETGAGIDLLTDFFRQQYAEAWHA